MFNPGDDVVTAADLGEDNEVEEELLPDPGDVIVVCEADKGGGRGEELGMGDAPVDVVMNLPPLSSVVGGRGELI